MMKPHWLGDWCCGGWGMLLPTAFARLSSDMTLRIRSRVIVLLPALEGLEPSEAMAAILASGRDAGDTLPCAGAAPLCVSGDTVALLMEPWDPERAGPIFALRWRSCTVMRTRSTACSIRSSSAGLSMLQQTCVSLTILTLPGTSNFLTLRVASNSGPASEPVPLSQSRRRPLQEAGAQGLAVLAATATAATATA